MIVIHISGLPNNYQPEKARALLRALEKTAVTIVSKDQIHAQRAMIYLPKDHVAEELGQYLFISALISLGSETELTSLSSQLYATVRRFFKTAQIAYETRSSNAIDYNWGINEKIQIESDPALPKCPICNCGCRSIDSGKQRECVNCGDVRNTTIN